jgi:hypothetical protein
MCKEWERGNTRWSRPQNANHTAAELELLRQMAQCWIELISNAQYVVAWSVDGADILKPLDWFVLNDVFEVQAAVREEVLKHLGWQQKKNGWFGDLTFSSKNKDARYIDLSAAFAEGKDLRNLEDAARKWLQKDPNSGNTFKTLEKKQLDQLYAVADNRTKATDMLCFENDIAREVDGLIFSNYDELCQKLTGHSLLAYNDEDVSLMHQLMSVRSSETSLPKLSSDFLTFMYDENGKLKFRRPVSYSNPLIFADWHADVRKSILARENRAGEKRMIKRQNAMSKKNTEPEASLLVGVSCANPYVIAYSSAIQIRKTRTLAGRHAHDNKKSTCMFVAVPRLEYVCVAKPPPAGCSAAQAQGAAE